MRRCLLLASLLSITSACGAEKFEEPAIYRLYYLGGQSNMDGFGYSDELPRQYKAEHPRVMIYRGQSAMDNSPEGGVGRWDRLKPGYGRSFNSDGDTNSFSRRFGPELTFGYQMANLYQDANIAIIKYSRSGTPLFPGAEGKGNWSPDAAGTNQYDFALRTISDAIGITDIDGDGKPDRLVPSGIVWMQGEADAFDSAEAADAYEDNLRTLMELFRAALHADDLPVAIGQITDSGREADGKVMDWADTVREAQRRYTDQDPCAVLVTETNNLNYPEDDNWHYDSESYIRLGIAFADAIAQLADSCLTVQ